MTGARSAGIAATFLVAACMPARYRETPPEPASRPAGAAADGSTVVGHVAPDGTLVADTLARAIPDTARVERETVLTGEIHPVTGPGWRVQVYAAREEAEAAAVAERARAALGGEAPVYLERDDPWYKVRVGDLEDRAGAERLRERLVGLGWPEAWVVETTIRRAP